MLDTNIVSNMLRYPLGQAANRFLGFAKGQLSISVITAAELQFGAVKVGSARLLEQLKVAATLYDVLPLDRRAVEAHAHLRTDLERVGTPIGPLDRLIVAHALSLDPILATDNVHEFSRVHGLRVENWLD